MAQRKKSRQQTKQRRVARSTRVETLEARQVMSANPLSAPALGHHSFIEVEDSVPTLSQHAAPSFSHHALLEPEGGAPSLGHHLQGGGLQGAGFGRGIVESAPVRDPNADFWINTEVSSGSVVADDLGGQIEQMLQDAHGLTGQDEVVSKYGFDGTGQTVVVIDSGIAYNHYALGGGYGEGYRVVGGWDFTENDADPYDDGPSGAHGTHVAGIIGSSDAVHSGVATGVDLVGLRVFDDAGNGYFSWVDSALDWVYANRNAFDNPITAVNLSLGAEYNAHTAPAWAMLEDEFAALEAEGIFISVSAGNSFTNYNTSGVSYPASSDHVIPVMSVDNNGSLSYFSQRADYAIGAPGRWITSTVPDYAAGDADTIDDDWLSMSGTSMAAPYVAGASVLVREAMEFVGQTGVDQWDIYNHMMATADDFFDSATNAWYKRLNLEAAIDALMPTDDFGSSVATAHSLGTIDPPSSNPLSLGVTSGVISTLDDSDYFSFTAGATGTITATVSGETHSLDVDWWGAGWTEDSPGVYTMDVLSGQSYTFAVGTNDGLGYYDVALELESTFSAIEWGAVGPQQAYDDLSVSGESWFNVTAGAGGFLTADVVSTAGSVVLEWYDAQQNLLVGDGGGGRVDALATQGEQFFLRVSGASADLDLRLTNAVSVGGTTVSVLGTAGDDSLSFTAGASEHALSLNGVSYAFSAVMYDTFALDGGGGTDSVTLTGTSGADVVTMGEESSQVVGSGYTASAVGYTSASVFGGGGYDLATLNDGAGNDQLRAYHDRVELSIAGGASLRAHDFSRTWVHSSGGHDVAHLYDTSEADTFAAWGDRAVMYGTGYFNDARGFDRVHGYSTTGNDRAALYDTENADTYVAWSDRAMMYGQGFRNEAHGFARTLAYSTAGADRAFFYDSAGDDSYVGRSDRASMFGAGYRNDAYGFSRSYAYATTGSDRATMYDTAGDEVYVARADQVTIYGQAFRNDAFGFDRTFAYATEGNDRATFYDTSGADTYAAWSHRAIMYGDGFRNDSFGFDRTVGYATAGADRAIFYDSLGDDLFSGWSDRVSMSGDGYENTAYGFARAFGYGGEGSDRATFHGSDEGEAVRVRSWGAFVTGETYRSDVRGFDHIVANEGGAGADSLELIAVDYLFETVGDWT